MEHHLARWTGLALGLLAGCGTQATIGLLPADPRDGGSPPDGTLDAGRTIDGAAMEDAAMEDAAMLPGAPAPWPMVGQGPTHQSRSASKITPSASRRSWELLLGEVLYASPVIAADGTIYAATEHALHAVSASGIEKWALPIQYPSWSRVPGPCEGCWQEEEVPSPAIGPDGTVYVKNGLALDAINPTGTLKWEAQFRLGVLTSPTIAADGTIYIATSDGGVVGLSPDGSTKIALLEPVMIPGSSLSLTNSTPAIATDGTIVFMEATAGIGHPAYFYSPVLVARAPDGTPLMGGSGGGFTSTLQQYPVIGAKGSTYVPGPGGALYAVDAARKDLWFGWWGVGSDGHFSNLAVADDGTLYLALHRACRGSAPDCVHAYYGDGTDSPSKGVGTGVTAFAPDGTVKWTFATGDDVWMSSLSVASDGTLYGAGNKFYRLDAAGKLVSVIELVSPSASPIAIGEDGTAIFGTKDGKLYAR